MIYENYNFLVFLAIFWYFLTFFDVFRDLVGALSWKQLLTYLSCIINHTANWFHEIFSIGRFFIHSFEGLWYYNIHIQKCQSWFPVKYQTSEFFQLHPHYFLKSKNDFITHNVSSWIVFSWGQIFNAWMFQNTFFS